MLNLSRKKTILLVSLLLILTVGVHTFCSAAIHIDVSEYGTYNADEAAQLMSDLLPTDTTAAQVTATTRDSGWAYYYLTPAERDVVERVVMAEAGGESRLGQMAVAQCILTSCYEEGIRPGQAVERDRYTGSRPEPTDAVKAAVSEVFDEGTMAVAEPIRVFYAPASVSGAGHERRHEYVCTIGGHKFFKSKEDK